jgi:7-cyano-7-deazaguanine synthase
VAKVAQEKFPELMRTHEIIQLGPVLRGTSPLVNRREKLEQYKDHASLPGGLEKTFVPMRNQLFLTIAANRAYVLGCELMVTGVSQEDYGGYPDCRQSFISAFEAACREGSFNNDTGKRLTVATPLMHVSKAESIAMALTYTGCYRALAYSHTAYDGIYPPRGNDHATLLRAKGFEVAGVPDPLVLRAFHEEMMALPETPNYAPALVARYSEML